MKNLLILLGLIIFIELITFSQSIRCPISFIIETNYLSQPYDQKGFIKGGLFLISYLVSLAALSSILFISKPWVAIALIALCSLVFGIDVYAQLLGSNPNGISVEGLSTALSEQGRLKDLLVYRTLLIDSLLASLAFFIFSVLLNRLITKTYRLWYGWSILSLVLITLSIGLLSHKIFSIKNQSYPAPIKLPLVFNEYLADRPFNQLRTLSPTIKPEHSAEYETIVWIIDESILGSHLSINGYAQDTTPFLKSISLSESMQNYGIVNSISNCSNTSNLLLRIGLTTTLNQDFKTAKNNLPTIFQYAKRAGFETILMDGQIVPGELQNHLNAHDLKFIDQYTAYPRSIYPQQRDRELLKSLVPLLAKPTNKRFIVVIKWGAHWPYPLAYPKEQTFFSPAATETLTEMTPANKELITNTYLNAVRYSADDFLKQLLATLNLDQQIIFYTSDHGQSLFATEHTELTHCHYADDPSTLPLGEFKVPLLVFTKDAKQAFPKLEDRVYSQEALFPTTLKLLGYDAKVYAAYGATLWQGSKTEQVQSFVLDSGLKINIPKSALLPEQAP